MLFFLGLAVLSLNGCASKEKQSTTAIPVDPNTQFTATPNPITVTDGGFQGVTTLAWHTTRTQFAEVHVGAPNGTLVCAFGATGSCQTGKWVTDGMSFYLQNTAAAKPTDPSATLGEVIVRVVK